MDVNIFGLLSNLIVSDISFCDLLTATVMGLSHTIGVTDAMTSLGLSPMVMLVHTIPVNLPMQCYLLGFSYLVGRVLSMGL